CSAALTGILPVTAARSEGLHCAVRGLQVSAIPVSSKGTSLNFPSAQVQIDCAPGETLAKQARSTAKSIYPTKPLAGQVTWSSVNKPTTDLDSRSSSAGNTSSAVAVDSRGTTSR
ncbi:MAG: hypothetical protein U1E02_03505, partial [Hydrogenophaga sp.]|nr:hypothetical protein [Hydrogenophaga sp.]